MGQSTSVTYQPDESNAVDCFVTYSSSPPGGGSEEGNTLRIGEHATSGNKRTLMKWDLTALPSSAIVSGATLTLNFDSANGMSSDHAAKLYRVTTDFDEDSTWYSKGSSDWTTAGGDYTTSGGVSFTASNSTDLVLNDADFIALVQDAITNQSGSLRVILGFANDFAGGLVASNNVMKYDSSSASTASERPKLSISYEAVTSWTGASGDGSAATTGNWSNGLPGAGVRAVINATDQDISGSITAESVHFGPNFTGKWGRSGSNRSDITTHKCVVNSKGAQIFVTFVQAGVYTAPALYLAEAPSRKDGTSFTGAINKIYVNNATQDTPITLTTSGTLNVAPKSRAKISLSTDSEGAINVSRQGEVIHAGTPATCEVHTGGKLRVDGDDSETAGPISASVSSEVDFRAATLTGDCYFSSNAKLDCRDSNRSGVLFGTGLYFLKEGVGLLHNGLDLSDLSSAVNMYGGHFIVDEGVSIQAGSIVSTY